MDTDTELQRLLEEIDSYLAATGMRPTALGRYCVNDTAAISRMRNGAGITSANMSRFRRYMAENPPPSTEEPPSQAAE